MKPKPIGGAPPLGWSDWLIFGLIVAGVIMVVWVAAELMPQDTAASLGTCVQAQDDE